MDEQLVLKLINLIQNGAPVLWTIALKQVTVLNIQDFIIALIFIAIILAMYKFLSNLRNEDDLEYHEEKDKRFHYVDDEFYTLFKFLSWLGILLSSTLIICNVTSIVMRFINPEYYTLGILLHLIK
jgi:hypothetical protein